MEIIIIAGAIGIVFAHIFLSTKPKGEIAQKRNPGFKSSLRHNLDGTSLEEVFEVLKENNIKPCFLEADLIKQNNVTLTDTTLISSSLSKIGDDRGSLFNPQPKDNRSTLKVIGDGLKKVGGIKIESQKDALDDISPELLFQLGIHQISKQSQDERSSLQVAKAGIRKAGVIRIEAQKDALDDINTKLISQLTETHQFEKQEQSGPVLTKKLTSPRNIGSKYEN